jgi:hypothetical protein
MEKEYPGLWQRWFKHQCVAVGWRPGLGYKLYGDTRIGNGWSVARKRLKEIKEGDWILVQLKNHRVGRIGQVVKKEIADNEWNPLVPRSRSEKQGHMGRRINVRWRLDIGPSDPGMLVKLPESKRLRNPLPAIAKLDRATFESIVSSMEDVMNWRSLFSKFNYEHFLSDYIATYPHQIEDGLQPYPSEKVREKVFKDGSRSDVLLVDPKENAVVVECKQSTPTVGDVKQLRGYMKHVRILTGKNPRGILIHGGARKLRPEVRREASHKPRIEVLKYSLNVDFASSSL